MHPETYKEIIIMIDSSNLERQYAEASKLITQGRVETAKKILKVLMAAKKRPP